MRTFETGATKSGDEMKIDYEGILSPVVLERYGEYMRKHTVQADGAKRASDNWQKGIPRAEYLKSALRHIVDWWKMHRSLYAYPRIELEDTLCAVMFNVMGYLHELLSSRASKEEGGGGILPCDRHGSPLPPEAGYIHTNKRSE